MADTYVLHAVDESGTDITYCTSGAVVSLQLELGVEEGERKAISDRKLTFEWSVDGGSILDLPKVQKENPIVHWDTTGISGIKTATVKVPDLIDPDDSTKTLVRSVQINIRQSPVGQQVDSLRVSMQRSSTKPTKDQAFWAAIRNRTKAIRFSGSGYNDFVSKFLGAPDTSEIEKIPAPNRLALKRQRQELFTPIQGVGSYELLKTATQVFLLMKAGVVIEEQDHYSGEALYDPSEEFSRFGRLLSLDEVQRQLQNYLGGGSLPYLRHILENAFKGLSGDGVFRDGFLETRIAEPSMLELIWSYWMEEGMLVQSMNAVCLRFQNRRVGTGRDPLANMEIAPLYPINNLLWGYIQDDLNRLSVRRRAYEYDHHYGLTLYGKVVPEFNPADSRSKFLEAFHNLLYTAAAFYKRDDDTTVVADGFPLLNALKEVHLILAQGAHNQFGDLPWTARAEMLMQQYILARPELRKFLQSREMVPYKEGWMAQVDTMKSIQGWSDVSITHFQNLAEFGEQLLLSIRYGDWIKVEDANQAANWARYWRPEIQGYTHSYRAATGVDLITDTRDSRQLALIATQPGILLRQQLTEGSRRLPEPVENVQTSGFRARRQTPVP